MGEKGLVPGVAGSGRGPGVEGRPRESSNDLKSVSMEPNPGEDKGRGSSQMGKLKARGLPTVTNAVKHTHPRGPSRTLHPGELMAKSSKPMSREDLKSNQRRGCMRWGPMTGTFATFATGALGQQTGGGRSPPPSRPHTPNKQKTKACRFYM